MDKDKEGPGPQSGAYGGAKISPKGNVESGKGSASVRTTFPKIFGKLEEEEVEAGPSGSQALPGGSNPPGGGTQGRSIPMEESTLGSSLETRLKELYKEEAQTVSETGRSTSGDEQRMEEVLSKKEKRKRKRQEKRRKKQEASFTEREPKRPKRENKNLQVAVLRQDGEKMEEEDAEYVRDILITYVKKENRGGTPEEGVSLRFEKSGLVEEGLFLITCADEITFSFMRERLIVPDWGEKAYLVLAGEEVPKMVRVTGFFPGKRAVTRPTTEILTYLNDQNPELESEIPRWRVIGRYTVGNTKGLKLVILVPPSTVERLDLLDWRPYYEITRVNFRRAGERREDQETQVRAE